MIIAGNFQRHKCSASNFEAAKRVPPMLSIPSIFKRPRRTHPPTWYTRDTDGGPIPNRRRTGAHPAVTRTVLTQVEQAPRSNSTTAAWVNHMADKWNEWMICFGFIFWGVKTAAKIVYSVHTKPAHSYSELEFGIHPQEWTRLTYSIHLNSAVQGHSFGPQLPKGGTQVSFQVPRSSTKGTPALINGVIFFSLPR